MKKKYNYLFMVLALLFALPIGLVYADGATNATLTSLIGDLIGIINQVTILLVGIAVLTFIGCMIKFFATADDIQARTEWRGYMIYAVIAFAIISGLWGLVNATLNLFGLEGGGGPQFPTDGGVIDCESGFHPNPVLGPGVVDCVRD